MPTYSIQGPDNKTYSIDGPEGATRDQIIAKIKERTPATSAAEPTAPRGIMDKLFGRTGPRYQTFPERAVRGALGSVENLMDAASSAPPGSRQLSENLAAPSMEAATVFSPMGPESRLAREGLKAAKATIPTQEELATAAVAKGYKGGIMDVPLADHVLGDIQTNILDHLHAEHYRDYGAPFVFRAVKELEPVKGKLPTIADIETVRQVLGKAPLDQRSAANLARNKISDYLSELQAHDTTLGTDAGTVLKGIRGNYAALKRSELITQKAEDATRGAQTSGMGANLDNKLRQAIKSIRNNPKLSRGFSEAELKEMDKVIKGGKMTNLARIFSRFGPEHPLTGWGMAGIEGLKHMRLLPLLQLAGGHAAQKYAEHATQKGVRKLDEMVRQRSPLFKEQGVPQKPIGPADSMGLSIGARAPLEAGPPKDDTLTYLRQQGYL